MADPNQVQHLLWASQVQRLERHVVEQLDREVASLRVVGVAGDVPARSSTAAGLTVF